MGSGLPEVSVTDIFYNKPTDFLVAATYGRGIFYWSPRHDWQAVNVSQITGQKIASPLTSWQTPDGPVNVEHLAGMAPNGDVLVFYWSSRYDWQAVNISRTTGQHLANPLTSWQIPDGPFNVEHLAGMTPQGDVQVIYLTDWQST